MRMGVRAAVAAGLLFLLCVPGVVDFAGARLRSAYPAPGQLVSAGTERLHVYCMGTGGTAIILESGLGIDWEAWHVVIPELMTLGRVCVYDRAGYGWSEPGPEPRTGLRLASELHTLLYNAGVRPPIVMMAHSFGAYVTRLFAAGFPQALRGVILVDPSDEDEPKHRQSLQRRIHYLLPPSGLAGLLRLCEGERSIPAELRSLPTAFRNRFMVGGSHNEGAAERGEYNALKATENLARASVFPRSIPLTVVTAGYVVAPRGGVPAFEVFAGHAALQAKLASMSSHGKQIMAPDSGHTVQLDRPDLVIRAVREMIQAF